MIKAFRQEGCSVSGVGEQLARQLAQRLLARRWQAGLLARLVSLLPPGEAMELLRAIEAAGLLHPGAVAQALKSARELCAHHAPGEIAVTSQDPRQKRWPQARGNPDGLSICFGVSGN
ncbi:MAG: hypothetical protein LBU11_09640 [Zoogloeaceae bacterium]|nr:hypothetical protein [Zoogloeaceae bacterium]